jgi:hypothetical protein
VSSTDTALQIEEGPNLTPLPSGPVQLERAWHNLMWQLTVKNVGYAHGVKVVRRNLYSYMAHR